MRDHARIARAVARLLPQGLAIGWADPKQPPGALLDGETPGAAIPRRLAEFAAGRSAARMAMAGLGHPPQPIPTAPDRAPIWPAGLTGSITHSDRLCLAIIGRSTQWAGLGIDTEPAEPLDPALWPIILRPEEGLPAPDPATAKLIFSAKEAVYKAQYPISKRLFGFDALTVDLGDMTFRARFATAMPPFDQGHEIVGKYCEIDGQIITIAWVAHQSDMMPNVPSGTFRSSDR